MPRALLALALAALALASCGGGGSSQAGSPCPARVADVLGAGARGTARARSLDVVTCDYRARRAAGTAGAGGAVVRVTVDTAPQAQVRFGRWVDERGQAYLGAPRAELPQVLAGIGDGAAWVPAARELVAVGNGRLVTVLVVRGERRRPLRATAVAVARAALAARAVAATAGASVRGGRASST